MTQISILFILITIYPRSLDFEVNFRCELVSPQALGPVRPVVMVDEL